MPGAAARRGVAGDLVGREPGGGEGGARVLEHHGDRLVVRTRQSAGARQRSEGRAALDGQRVGRDVIGCEADHLVDRPPPVVERLSGHAEHQVDRQVVEASRARGAHADRPRRRVVTAAEPPQQSIVEGLRADREPVDPLAAQRAQLRLAALARVHLDGDLQRARVRRAERLARRLDHPAERIGPPQPRRAAAKVDRGERPGPGVPRAASGDLGDHRVRVAVVRDVGARVDREVAIRTAHAAEREVHVHAHRLARPQRAGGGIVLRRGARRSAHRDSHRTSL